MKPTFLLVLLCLPLLSYCQIVFEEISSPGDFSIVEEVDESGNDHQFALTSVALFSKYESDSSWLELNIQEVSDAQVHYSPDGDLYISRPNHIWHSRDNGHSIRVISLPNNGFALDEYILEVLDDEMIFLIGSVFGDCYYSINNGQDWIFAGLIRFDQKPVVKLVGNYILVAAQESNLIVTKIKLATNEITSNELDFFAGSDYFSATILDDGTIYFHRFNTTNGVSKGLYQYRFGEEMMDLGLFDELTYAIFQTAGNELFSFGQDEYYEFDGESFTDFHYIGLPLSGHKKFSIAENDYLFVIIDDQQIFRSSNPLASPNISGNIYHGENLDCVFDGSDPGLKNWQVRIENDDFIRIRSTNGEGQFYFTAPDGDYTISALPITENWELCEMEYSVAINENNPTINQDFLAKGLVECAELEIDFSTPLLRRCFDNYYSIRVRNTGPGLSESTTLTLQLDPFFEFISASMPYTLEGSNILKFELGALAVNEEISIQVSFKLSCDADLGMEHCLTGFLKDDNECGGDRSTYTECQENIGAYDPNDKRVFNIDGIETESVEKGEYVYYHIRFQNTGTDTAFNIRVVDPLSPMLDLSTLEMLSASHPYEFVIIDGPNLEVTFKNILLPDSIVNEPLSHGFFKFRIKPLPEYDYGTMIPNRADIYFDFNDPVQTNEVPVIILPTAGIEDAIEFIEFNVFPNPAHYEISLTVSETDLQRTDSYEIIDQLGQVVSQSAFLHKHQININQLASGLYNLILKQNGVIVGMSKFVIL